MHVVLREGESGDSLINRFRSEVTRSQLLKELKKRRYFRSKGEKEREALRQSIRRHQRASRRRHMTR